MRIERSFIQIHGVGEKTERTLWEAGITDWRNGIPDAPVGPKTSERLAAFADRATSALHDEHVDFFTSRLPAGERWRALETFRDRMTTLDIETTGLDRTRDRVTTVTLDGPRETTTLVRGRDLTADRLAAALEQADLLVTFNGAQFDVPFLESAFDLQIDRPHVDLRYPCRRAGWTGGLKRVERELGIERDLPAVDGREAVRLWHRYESGDEDALDRLIRYNREDTRTLRPVADRVVETLDRHVLDPHLESPSG